MSTTKSSFLMPIPMRGDNFTDPNVVSENGHYVLKAGPWYYTGADNYRVAQWSREIADAAVFGKVRATVLANAMNRTPNHGVEVVAA